MRREWPLMLILTTACASVGGMRTAPLDQGVVRHFEAELRPAVLAVRNAMGGSQLEIEEVSEIDDTTWMIIAKRSGGEWTWGELVRAVIVEESPGRVAVWIYTRRRMATNITAKGDWSDELFSQIALELGGSD